MNAETWASVGVSVATAAAGLWAARAARRTPRQERRDDFTAITSRMDLNIARLETRVDEQQDQITGQGAAISWLVTDRHSLVGYIRKSGLEPPAPRPIPLRAQPFLNHVDL
jgi:hypothetical protein